MVSYQHRVNAVWQDGGWVPDDGQWPIKWIGEPQALLGVHQSLGGIWIAAQAGSVKAQRCIAWADSAGESWCWCRHDRPWLEPVPDPDPLPPPSDDITMTRADAELLIQDATHIIETLRGRLEQ